MVSGQKVYIRLVEALALLDAGIAGIVGSLILFSVLELSAIRPLEVAVFAPMVLIFGTAAVLVGEFARLHPDERQCPGRRWLSSAEFAELIHWSPRWLNVTVALLFIYSLAMIVSARAGWTSSQSVARREALSDWFMLSTFVLVSLPILASASRMPGTFSDQVD